MNHKTHGDDPRGRLPDSVTLSASCGLLAGEDGGSMLKLVEAIEGDLVGAGAMGEKVEPVRLHRR